MTIKKAINTPYARIAIAAVLGFGLSTLFRKSCKDKECIDFKAPAFKTIEEGLWKVDDKCYAFKSSPAECDKSRRTVDFA
jgi:hypothetical protein